MTDIRQRNAARNAKKFTPTSVFSLKRPKAGHLQHWDADAHGRGLSTRHEPRPLCRDGRCPTAAKAPSSPVKVSRRED